MSIPLSLAGGKDLPLASVCVGHLLVALLADHWLRRQELPGAEVRRANVGGVGARDEFVRQSIDGYSQYVAYGILCVARSLTSLREGGSGGGPFVSLVCFMAPRDNELT